MSLLLFNYWLFVKREEIYQSMLTPYMQEARHTAFRDVFLFALSGIADELVLIKSNLLGVGTS